MGNEVPIRDRNIISTRVYPMDDLAISLGRRLYRIFLLAVLFGILIYKGYLWTTFLLVLFLYLFEAIIMPVLAMEAARRLEPEPEPNEEPPPRRRPDPVEMDTRGHEVTSIGLAYHASVAGKYSAIRSS